MWILIFLDLLLCLIIYPFTLAFLLPLYLYRLFVIYVAKVIQPNLIPLGTCDQFMAWDLMTPRREGKRLVYSVGCAVRVNGKISLEVLRNKISTRFLAAVDENGEKMYPKGFEYLTMFGGYAFRKPVQKVDIQWHVRQVELGNRSLNEFQTEWIGTPFPEKTPAWEMLLVPLGDGGTETVLLLKIHHSMADAYSLLHFFNTLMDNKVPAMPKEPDDTFGQKVLQALQCPRKMMIYSWNVLLTRKSLVFAPDNRDLPCFSSSTALYLSDFKKIQRFTGTAYTSLTLALFGGVLARILAENEAKLSEKEKLVSNADRATYVQLSFARPNHPVSKMCNHWTSGGVRVPIGPMRAIDRLRAIDADHNSFLNQSMEKIMYRFMFPVGGLLPTRIFPVFFEATRRLNGLRTIFTSASGYNDGFYEMDGNPIFSFSPVVGFIGTSPSIGLSYNDRYEVFLTATSEIAKDQETMDTIVNSYFADEVEALMEQIISKS